MKNLLRKNKQKTKQIETNEQTKKSTTPRHRIFRFEKK